MQISREEAKYYYRKYAQAYEEAKTNRNNAKNAVDTYKTQKKTQESNLTSCRTQKRNLEARLADIKVIISLLDNKVPAFIDKANKSVRVVDEIYSSAIKCSAVTVASVQTAFYTKNVNEDGNSADAYQRCQDEKRRLEEGIEDLRIRMNAISNAIETLSSSIRLATNQVSSFHSDMNSYRNKANFYGMYL